MIDRSRKEGRPITRTELLQFEGISRHILELRIIALVRVLDAASELVVAADAAQDEQCKQALEQLRSALKAV